MAAPEPLLQQERPRLRGTPAAGSSSAPSRRLTARPVRPRRVPQHEHHAPARGHPPPQQRGTRRPSRPTATSGSPPMNSTEARQLFEVRLSLDPTAAELAAQRRTDDDIATMRAAVDKLLPVTRQWGEEALTAHRDLPPGAVPGLAQRRPDPSPGRPVGQVRPLPAPRPRTPARRRTPHPGPPGTPPTRRPHRGRPAAEAAAADARPHHPQPHRHRHQRPRRPRGHSRDVTRGDRRRRDAWGRTDGHA